MQHGTTFGRGVWVAPWLGENGELIVVAVDRNKRQVGTPRLIPFGGSHMAASNELWDELERHDPIPILKLI